VTHLVHQTGHACIAFSYELHLAGQKTRVRITVATTGTSDGRFVRAANKLLPAAATRNKLPSLEKIRYRQVL
jgi:hypothetical protein